ncbi:MAG: hypothetical protein EOO88_62125 [Pedobacter sp.]|nr:MAG: hypothetical protein EOO88_62125 [Pedobacter sp.]
MLGAFVVSYVAQNFLPFIISGKYRQTSMMLVMFEPYGRIFIQQFTVILGSMFLTFGWGKGFIVVFAAAKLFFDLYIDFSKIISKGVDDMQKQEPGSS